MYLPPFPRGDAHFFGERRSRFPAPSRFKVRAQRSFASRTRPREELRGSPFIPATSESSEKGAPAPRPPRPPEGEKWRFIGFLIKAWQASRAMQKYEREDGEASRAGGKKHPFSTDPLGALYLTFSKEAKSGKINIFFTKLAFSRTPSPAARNRAPKPSGTTSRYQLLYRFSTSQVHFRRPRLAGAITTEPKRLLPGAAPEGQNDDS